MRNHPHEQKRFSKNQRQLSGLKVSPWQYALDQEGLPPLCPVARHEGRLHVLNTPHGPCGGHSAKESERCRWAVGIEGHPSSTSSERIQQVHNIYSTMFYAL